MLRLGHLGADRHTVLQNGGTVLLSLVAVTACAIFLSGVSPSAVAAPGDPAKAGPPKRLWDAFPLNPKGERLPSTSKLDAQQRGSQAPFTPPATPQAVAEAPAEPSDDAFPLLAVAGGVGALALLALLGAAMRLRHLETQRRSAPLWQGTAGIEASPVARLQRYADVDVSLTQPSRFSTGLVARRSGSLERRSRPQSTRSRGPVVRRVRRAVWNDNTVPYVVGSAMAIVAAFLIIYLVG